MASPATPTYEILALRYGIFDGRIAAQNYLMPDDHMAPDPLDFLVFAIQGQWDRTTHAPSSWTPVSIRSPPSGAGASCCARRPRRCAMPASMPPRCAT